MDFESAVRISKELEQSFDRLLVSGFRRMSSERFDSWAIDVVDSETGGLVTLDEKDNWERVLQVNFPELSKVR
ncbi:MAG TPA: hypothetical protein VFS30_16310 [Dehalococcoidia bacterium]|nr:hypothetical protein [Dehalococcoidia bacterium]